LHVEKESGEAKEGAEEFVSIRDIIDGLGPERVRAEKQRDYERTELILDYCVCDIEYEQSARRMQEQVRKMISDGVEFPKMVIESE
jgi:hypothetical protein